MGFVLQCVPFHVVPAAEQRAAFSELVVRVPLDRQVYPDNAVMITRS